jgi:hypothetical protein
VLPRLWPRACVLAGALCLALPAPAVHADLGAPFGSALLECDVADGYQPGEGLGKTAAVSRTYSMPMVEIVGTSPTASYGSVNLHGGRSVEYQDDTWFPRTPVRYWAQTGTLQPGESATIEADCGEQAFDSGGKFHVDARYYARPPTPVTYAGSSNHGRSVIGFVAPRSGRYIAEVEPSPGEPRDLYFGDFPVENGEWDEPSLAQEESKGATFNSAGVLELGMLPAGAHALMVRGTWSDDAAALENWSVTIREVTPEQPKPSLPEPPVSNPAPPPAADPPVGPPGPIGPQGPPGVASVQAPAVASGSQVAPTQTAPPGGAVLGTQVDRRKPRLRLTLTRPSRRMTVIRVWAVSERATVLVTIRKGDTTRRVTRRLRKGQSLTVHTRWRGGRVTITGRDLAGNVATIRRAFS